MKIETYEQARSALEENVDLKYKAFNDPIINCEYGSLGVRTPIIKKLAKSVPIEKRDDIIKAFFADAEGRRIYDVVLFIGCLAARKGDYEATREYLKKLIPVFGSWAHTDCVVPLLDWVDTDRVLKDFSYLLNCEGQYEKRFYIIYMLGYCLDGAHIENTLHTLETKIAYGEYYVDMAAAWLLAEALVKQFDTTLPLIESKTLPVFVHNKAIQKARESYRISPETKNYLNTLKIKNK